MRLNIAFVFYITMVSLVVSSCNFSPKYIRDISLFSQKKDYDNALQEKLSANELVNWWDRLKDPLTSKLIKKLLSQNLTLKEASERVIQAREFSIIQGATKIPTVNLDNGASRSFATVQSPISGEQKKQYTNKFNANLNVSWQIDLFGKLKSARESAEANELAAEYDLQGITQTLIADLVNKRVSIYLNSKLLQLSRENTKNAEKLYLATKKRYELGARNIKLANLYMAKENYESSKKDIYQYERLVADEIYKLDVLLGQTPGSIRKSSLTRKIQLPASINTSGVPLQLLDRRPDLKSAEIKIVAANADIGVAVADLYPNLLINSGIGYSSDKVNNLFISENMSGSILGQITTRIFAGGALKSNIKIKESKARALSASYSNKILSAIQEVESNLKTENKSLLDYKTQKSSLKLFERTEKQMGVRYIRGIESLNKLLESRKKTYNAHKLLIASEYKLWQSRIALYLSLGGDWLEKN